ncbi:hypothetical protein C8R45DRAFT_1148848 [Mycena sanguinolenta]|nr:hypothetical protein C8R45DRAFT_1148848 [Mycena sanguinolenta]
MLDDTDIPLCYIQTTLHPDPTPNFCLRRNLCQSVVVLAVLISVVGIPVVDVSVPDLLVLSVQRLFSLAERDGVGFGFHLPASLSSTAPPSPSSSTSPSSSASASSAASISHGASFYATIALGTLIFIACIAALVACLIRIRTHRRAAAAISTIAWDPAVLDGGKKGTATDLSLVGDCDVGEHRRSESFLAGGSTHTDSYQYQPTPPFDNPYQAPMNPLVETAYYSGAPARRRRGVPAPPTAAGAHDDDPALHPQRWAVPYCAPAPCAPR